MNNLKVEKALVVLNDNDVNVIKSASNLATVKTAQTNEINVYDILKYDTVVVTKDACLLYTSPSPRDRQKSRMPSSA